jgi:hypothetical protein
MPAMKPDAYLWQLTLNTGHTERRYRHEIEDHEFDAIRAMNPLKDGLVHIPAVGDDYYLQTRIDPAAGATTFTVLEKTPITAPEPVNAPIVTCILANREPDDTAWKIAEQLYLNLSDTRPYFGDALPDKPPSVPWLAVILIRDSPALEWLEDFELCYAWFLLENAAPGA